MQVSEQIIKIINELCEKFGIAIDWTQDNILPYIQALGHKVVMYDLYTSLMQLIIGSVLFIGVPLFLSKILRNNREDALERSKSNEFYYYDGSLNTLGILSLCAIVMLSVIGVMCIVDNTQNIIQDLVFPEKTIMEFVRPYIK